MTKLFIWWHRRRAAHHGGEAAQHRSFGEYAAMNKHLFFNQWHLDQITRLSSAPERKLHAPTEIGLSECSETARD
jgi:hypothetical protein